MTNETKYKYLIDQWDEFETKIDEKLKSEIDNCFIEYIKKIEQKKFNLEDYSFPNDNDCSYYCNFMERKSASIYGSARPGNNYNYGISLIKEKINEKKYFINKKLLDDEQKGEKYKKENKKEEIIYSEEIAKTSFAKILNYLVDLVKEEIKEEITDIIKNIESEDRPINATHLLRKTVAMNNHGKFLYIYSNNAINLIYNFFIENTEETKKVNIEKNFLVTKELKKIFSLVDEACMIKFSRFIWSIFGASIQLESKNMILHGAPGTGKTYSIKNTVKNIILKQGGNLDEQLIFTQFHPSYSYEDFIDGIKPTGIDEKTGQLKLKLKNGAFKELCIKASKKLKEERIKGTEYKNLTKFFFVADEINRAELSRVFGELLICLEEDYRVDFDKEGKILKEENLITTQNSNLDTEPVYQIGNKNYFGVPTNLYFLGTMNDIDKSVDSFDMALRRRFYWKEIRCNYGYIDSLYNDGEFTKICIKLNRYITGFKEDEKNTGKMIKVNTVGKYESIRLGTSFELGHAYFNDIASINQTSINKLWDSKIEPLLKEYLRAEYSQDDIVNKLSEAKEIFSLPKTVKSTK